MSFSPDNEAVKFDSEDEP